MIATLVIGLREGLEAALIVGIIAAFLRRNGKSLRPMWFGVGLAVVLSLAVGIALGALEQALPQSAQEGLETVIGAVAVIFVTTMIVWMDGHARSMRRELEHEAADALGRGGAGALAVMAFLAVLKEGFETSVFLLATFSAAQSAALAAAGAVVGVLIAVAIGWGIYAGGVRINLGRFFRITGAFLILVAAGLVLSTLRTAHEAGWIVAGQQRVLDLSWLVTAGSVQSALITGVLGIPADPRAIEVVGWLAYLVPVALLVYWPPARRPAAAAAVRLRFVVAAALVVAAGALALAVPGAPAASASPLTLADGSGSVRLVAGADGRSLRVDPADASPSTVALRGAGTPSVDAGTAAREWTVTERAPVADAPSTVTLAEVTTANGGRLPVGLSPQEHPGPFAASWSRHTVTHIWIADGVLLDADSSTTEILTISGSGLGAPRPVTVSSGSTSWQASDAAVAGASGVLADRSAAADERALWGVQLPVALLVAALMTAAFGLRARRDLRRPAPDPASALTTAQPTTQPRSSHAASL